MGFRRASIPLFSLVGPALGERLAVSLYQTIPPAGCSRRLYSTETARWLYRAPWRSARRTRACSPAPRCSRSAPEIPRAATRRRPERRPQCRRRPATARRRWGTPTAGFRAERRKGRGGSAGFNSYLTSGCALGSPTRRPLAVAIFAGKTKFETYPCKPFIGEG